MPTIICSYCEYVGQGEEYEDRIADVEAHEEHCETRTADEMAKKIDAAYETARIEKILAKRRKHRERMCVPSRIPKDI